MIKNYMAIIYVGEGSENISPLTKARSLASIPVGGSYRIIDFALSNVVNAGIRNVGLFCGNEELNSLTDHIGNRSEEHTSELQSRQYLVCRLLLEKKKKNRI